MIRRIFKIGQGPSSSHSMAPRRAAEAFRDRLDAATERLQVHLYGSLAATGKGHLTDKAISDGLRPWPVEFAWHPEKILAGHANGMIFQALDGAGRIKTRWEVYSVGGGELSDRDGLIDERGEREMWKCDSLGDVLKQGGGQAALWQYVVQREGSAIWDFLGHVWEAMTGAIGRGLASQQAVLPGSLGLRRRAPAMLARANERVGFARDLSLLSAYALAVAEENAGGGQVVTAPTCGSSGVLPSVLYYFQRHNNAKPQAIREGLATAGLIGGIVAHRASISGAEVGCQGEIGTACSMAAAAAVQISGGTLSQAEYAAEMGLEHWLGLTCDPIAGLVQIPCIERNALAAMRAVECATYALCTDGRHLVSFDEVVDVMNATGRDLQAKYRETARGGLAEIRRERLEDGFPTGP